MKSKQNPAQHFQESFQANLHEIHLKSASIFILQKPQRSKEINKVVIDSALNMYFSDAQNVHFLPQK